MTYNELFAYEKWPSRPESWGQAARTSPWDQIDFHVDLGCGKLPKGRIGVDRYPAPGVNVVTDLERGITYGFPRSPGEDALIDGQLWNGAHESDYVAHLASGYELRSAPLPIEWRLPFEDSSIESIVSHHFFEHIGDAFIPLVDDIYRVLVPGGILRAITPLFPSWSAVSDPDHKRYFMAAYDEAGEVRTTWDSFCGTPDNCWLSSFSVPYTRARFERVDADFTAVTPPEAQWTPYDARELRVALKAVK
jgi:SAM-dependent methyltransferase